MKGKIGPMLLALPFFGVGVWAAWSISSNLFDAWQVQRWLPVEATLIRAGYETHSGDDSNTYKAYAEYRYVFDGRDYHNDRVAIAGGSDNIGSFQQDTGRRLQATLGRGETVTAYVDPQHPSDAVLDRTIRWGLLGLKSIFLFVFGGVGLGMLIYLFRSRASKEEQGTQTTGRPWLQNPDWQTNTISSNSKTAMYVTWGFAALWNLISAPLPFLVYAEFLEKNNKAALIGLLFPVIGLALLFWALRRTLEWRRFGAAPIALDPFPGAIGGHVGGTIDVGIPYSADAKFALTLTNLRSHISGTGKNRSRRETADWQDTLVAHTAPVAQGTRLSFRFDVPEGLAESDADRSKDDYHLWRLHVQAELPGIDIDRDYEIPVYATAASSRQLGEYSMQQARSDQRRNDEAAIRKLLNFSLGSDGRRLYQPMGRTLAAGLAGFLFGAVFAGAGWFLGRSAGHWFMGGIFGFVGAAILVSGLYFLFNSLEVRQSGDSIESIRRILGIQVRNRRMRRADFQSFDKKSTLQTQSGGKKVMHYSVYAIGRDGTRVVLGEGFRGASQADTAADMIGRQFGLSPVSASRPDDDPLGPD